MQSAQPVRRLRAYCGITLALLFGIFYCEPAFGLIQGGEGNQPVEARGWPRGVASIFNHQARIAWWEGPPFGGGQWHAEYRGDAAILNVILSEFGQLDIKTKRVVVHDGIGYSFWLNRNRELEKREKSRMDWSLMVWEPGNWRQLRNLPADLNPTDPKDAAAGPPTQIDVYTGGHVRWKDVVVPDGIEVIDHRLQTHGFTLTDGPVAQGKVTDLTSNAALQARVRLESYTRKATGGYDYTVVARAVTDDQGEWALTNVPAGRHRVIVEADTYAPRIAGYAVFDKQPRWYPFDTGLSPAANVSGRVVDAEGTALAGVDVRLANVVSGNEKYNSPGDVRVKTDNQGRFEIPLVPVGLATIKVSKSGYCRPGLGPKISIPADDIRLKMLQSASLRVTVDFTGTIVKPPQYLVQMEPEGGSAVGKWGGSGNIDAQDQIEFQNIPPGRYIVRGGPNPGSSHEQTKPVTIELKGGQDAKLTLMAR